MRRRKKQTSGEEPLKDATPKTGATHMPESPSGKTRIIPEESVDTGVVCGTPITTNTFSGAAEYLQVKLKRRTLPAVRPLSSVLVLGGRALRRQLIGVRHIPMGLSAKMKRMYEEIADIQAVPGTLIITPITDGAIVCLPKAPSQQPGQEKRVSRIVSLNRRKWVTI